MTQEEKLKGIIDKVEKAGWNPFSFIETRYALHRFDVGSRDLPIDSIFFSHDFARAFWGNELKTGNGILGWLPAWKYNLQIIAITPPADRIDYLYKFVN